MTGGVTGVVTGGCRAGALQLVVPRVSGSGTREALQAGPQAGPMPAGGAGTAAQGGGHSGHSGTDPLLWPWGSWLAARLLEGWSMLGGAGAAGAVVSAHPGLREPCRGCLSPASHPPLLSGAPPTPSTYHPRPRSRPSGPEPGPSACLAAADAGGRPATTAPSTRSQGRAGHTQASPSAPAPLLGPRPRLQHLRQVEERRRDKACASLGQGRRKGNPDHVGGTLPEGGAGPGTSQSRGRGHPKHSETIITIPASSQPQRKADSEPGPSLDLFYSTSVRNTIFIPISQMAKLRLREVEQLRSSSQQIRAEGPRLLPFPSP